MTAPSISSVKVGDELPALVKPPISRTTLALFAGASNDHNPIHIDTDFAKKAGMPDVFAHGMLVMAYMAELVTNWEPQSALREFGTRFGAITQLGEKINCTGKVTEIVTQNGETCARLELAAANEAGEQKLAGHALVALDA